MTLNRTPRPVMQRGRSRALPRILLFLALSAWLHYEAAVLLSPVLGPALAGDARAPGPKRTQVTLMTMPRRPEPPAAAQNAPPKPRDIQPEVVAEEPKPLAPDDPAARDKQIVDVAPSVDQTPPEQYDFLAEHNTRTEKETVARNRPTEYERAAPQISKAKVPQKPAPDKQGKPGEEAPQIALVTKPPAPEPGEAATDKEAASKFALPEAKLQQRLALKIDPDLGEVANRARREELHGGNDGMEVSMGQGDEEVQASRKGGEPTQPVTLASLMPGKETMAQYTGSPAPDHLPEVAKGDATFLNAREFVYAAFFNRVKQAVSKEWKPNIVYAARDPTGNVYGYRDRLTVLSLSITPRGQISTINVRQSSGIDFLDEEAIRAFRAAEPFPNPPAGLIKEGLISFDFGFNVEVGPSYGRFQPRRPY